MASLLLLILGAVVVLALVLGVGIVVLIKLGVIFQYATKDEAPDQGEYSLDQSHNSSED
jgi:hypothetical protein